MTIVNDTMVLDDFLQHNPKPRFLVFLYCPESLNPQSQRDNPIVTRFEAITWRFRQPHRLASISKLMRHPDDLFGWAEHGIRLAGEGVFVKPFPPGTGDIRYKTLGRVPFHDSPLISCTYSSHANSPDRTWVNGLRSRYGNNHTTVLIDSMQLPGCDPDLTYFRTHLSGLIDNEIGTLPVSDYYVGGRHVNTAGSVPLSDMVASQVLQRLSTVSPAGD